MGCDCPPALETPITLWGGGGILEGLRLPSAQELPATRWGAPEYLECRSAPSKVALQFVSFNYFY